MGGKPRKAPAFIAKKQARERLMLILQNLDESRTRLRRIIRQIDSLDRITKSPSSFLAHPSLAARLGANPMIARNSSHS